MASPPSCELYTYFRSSCSARVRIAAHYKGIDLKYHYIHLLKNEQQSESYTSTLNPSKSVPTLVIHNPDGTTHAIRQSVAILEYLEEAHLYSPSLLPPSADLLARAQVRDLVNIVASDTQPVTNLRILNKIKPAGIDAQAWQHEFMAAGLEAYERTIAGVGEGNTGCVGKYSVGDEVTMADVALCPAVDGALRFGVDIVGRFPTIWRVYQECLELEGFQKGGWRAQEDTPEELR